MCVEADVVRILLKMLLDDGLITADTYEGAVRIVNEEEEIPSFFKYDGPERRDFDGCT